MGYRIKKEFMKEFEVHEIVMDKEKPYLIIIHDKKSNNVDVVLGYFEYFSNGTTALPLPLSVTLITSML